MWNVFCIISAIKLQFEIQFYHIIFYDLDLISFFSTNEWMFMETVLTSLSERNMLISFAFLILAQYYTTF